MRRDKEKPSPRPKWGFLFLGRRVIYIIAKDVMKLARSQKGSIPILIAVLAVIVTAVVVVGVFYWQNLGSKGTEKGLPATETPPLAPIPTIFPSTPVPTADLYSGWSTYTNDVYDYQFRYPPGATIAEVDQSAFSLSPEEVDAGMTFEDKFREYTGKICMTVTHSLGYLQISAPANEGFAHVLCGRTGRAYEGPDRTETLTIDGDSYTATGFEEQGPGETLNYHNETLVVALADGTRIEYGSRPEETATFADYQAMRDEIIRIVESFRKI